MGEYGIDYGITENGFDIKRMDVILDEIHDDLTEGFGVDTRQSESSFLDALVTTFANQIADLWETAQDSYYAKYPSTAEGINLDNAVQFGGVRRKNAQSSIYPIHCTGDDGTQLSAGIEIGTTTMPQKTLSLDSDIEISRDNFNEIDIRVVSVESGTEYIITLDSINDITYTSVSGDDAEDILTSLKTSINNSSIGYTATVKQPTDDSNIYLLNIKSNSIFSNNSCELSENLTTESVTTIANFSTNDYGKIIIPNNVITDILDNVSGLKSITNIIEPTYGHDEETDIELRQSYLAKSELRSETMLGSIVSEILDNVNDVKTVSAFENDTNEISNGIPPHSISLIVEGGNDSEIAQAILRKKAGGIGTVGDVHIDVPTSYGDVVSINFSRPTNIYTWIYIGLYGENLPTNYESLIKNRIFEYLSSFSASTSLHIQKLEQIVYDVLKDVNFVTALNYTETSLSETEPSEEDYVFENVSVTRAQKIKTNLDMIKVEYLGTEISNDSDDNGEDDS